MRKNWANEKHISKDQPGRTRTGEKQMDETQTETTQIKIMKAKTGQKGLGKQKIYAWEQGGRKLYE